MCLGSVCVLVVSVCACGHSACLGSVCVLVVSVWAQGQCVY